ncbi:putative glycine--tRNA ligase [Colletotrichum gloeosporioides]|uniref:Putative glycine--tRNA ligase n=1 Tax=Colletotrichum gloeosporioides TaxID=474922 RepID=A0A8H4FL30_COLGL|nr:putative glycine--tRNA ligase [Colletotrichum gloeosporioides]KAF3806253.1 putative glycine--tRNA ligase [Colletotrichum gloeosporioides]
MEGGRDVLPLLGAVNQGLDGGDDGVLVAADLLGRVAVAEGDGVVLDGLEVDGDAEGRAELVVAAVALADGRGRVVHAGGDAELAQLLGDLLDEGLELRVGGEGHDQNLGRGDRRGEGENLVEDMKGGLITYTTSLIAAVRGGAVPVAVLNERVEDTADTEGRLDNVGSVFPGVLNALPELDLDKVLADLDLAVGDAGNLELQLAVVGELLGELLALLLCCRHQSTLDCPAVLLELRTKLLLVNLNLPLVDDEGLLAALAHQQGSAGLLGVDGQVVGAAVSAADTLDPARGGEELGVPAVGGVVGHLIGHVLAEADLCHVDTDLGQEQVDAGEEVAEGLVVDDLVLDGVANLHLAHVGLARELGVAVEQGELDVLDLDEAGVLLAALGVDKVLNLGHEELADSQQATSRGNLVSVGAADGGGGEGHLLHVEVEKLGKVEELALGGLGAQVALGVAGGADGGLEHEVEGDGRGGLLGGGRVPEVVLLDQLAELLAVVVVDLGQDLVVLLDEGVVELDGDGLLLPLGLLLGVILFLDLLAAGLLVAPEAGLEHILDEVVGTQDIAVLGVLAHPVGELVNVAGGLEDFVGGQDGAVELEHVFLEDEVLAPEVDDVGLESAAGRAIVEQTSDAAVDLEGGGEEETAAQHGVERRPVEGLALEGRRGGRHVVVGGGSTLLR